MPLNAPFRWSPPHERRATTSVKRRDLVDRALECLSHSLIGRMSHLAERGDFMSPHAWRVAQTQTRDRRCIPAYASHAAMPASRRLNRKSTRPEFLRVRRRGSESSVGDVSQMPGRRHRQHRLNPLGSSVPSVMESHVMNVSCGFREVNYNLEATDNRRLRCRRRSRCETRPRPPATADVASKPSCNRPVNFFSGDLPLRESPRKFPRVGPHVRASAFLIRRMRLESRLRRFQSCV